MYLYRINEIKFIRKTSSVPKFGFSVHIPDNLDLLNIRITVIKLNGVCFFKEIAF